MSPQPASPAGAIAATSGMLPDLVVHADWSGSEPRKRSVATARRLSDDRYSVDAPDAVGPIDSWLKQLRVPSAASGTVLMGFDFPIGVPAAYARKAGITTFRNALPKFGDGVWRDFYNVCRNQTEISLHRPFYPYRPGGTSRKDLTDALGIDWDDLYRQCERHTDSRRAACPLFWTVGGNQVGRSALSGWREILRPMLTHGDQVGLWPFDGRLVDLLRSRSCVIVETYPTEFYGHLGIRLPLEAKGGKLRLQARQNCRRQLLDEAVRVGAELSDKAHHAVTSGFDTDDPFDAFVGLLGMLKQVRAGSSLELPPDPLVPSVEGWILGQKAARWSDTPGSSN